MNTFSCTSNTDNVVVLYINPCKKCMIGWGGAAGIKSSLFGTDKNRPKTAVSTE